MPQGETLPFAILRQEADAGGDRVARRVDHDDLAVDSNLARLAAICAEEEAGGLGAAGADQPGDRENLAAADLERHVAHGSTAPQSGHLQPRAAERDRAGGKLALQLATDHHLDHLVARDPIDGAFADVGAVTEHGHAIGDGEDLVEPVADVDDADPVSSQLGDDREQALDLMRREGGRRLVHCEDPGVEGERPGDLDELLLGGREILAWDVQIDRGIETPEQLGRSETFLGPGDEAGPRRFLAEEDVLGGGEAGNEVEFLIDDRDASPAGVLRRSKASYVAVDDDAAGFGAIGAAEDSREGAFAGPVLAEQGEHLAALEGQVDAAQGPHARKGPDDAAHLEERRR
jgi:hypothetical protein